MPVKIGFLEITIHPDQERFAWRSLPQDGDRMRKVCARVSERFYRPRASVSLPNSVVAAPDIPAEWIDRFVWSIKVDGVQPTGKLPAEAWMRTLGSADRGVNLSWSTSDGCDLPNILDDIARDVSLAQTDSYSRHY